ncbi:hypothetical protein WP12_22965 [Sphingomonas sp. SRS2]|nr:hypothetical protein WP12_22965 [Sphingomonas sp. SRS2]
MAAVVIVHMLGFLLAFLMSPPFDLKKREAELKDFRLMTLAEEKVAPKPKPRASAAQKKKVVTETPPPPEQPVALPSPLPMIMVSRDVFASSDISRIPTRRSEGAPSVGESTSNGRDDGPGEGPGGERLYDPDWYREPTDAEMAYYMPKGAPRSGWGLIACRTVPDFRVEDCRELAESPSGSGIARAVRQAAWQFRVRPPRIGGKPVMGAWVRIRFDLTVGVKK